MLREQKTRVHKNGCKCENKSHLFSVSPDYVYIFVSSPSVSEHAFEFIQDRRKCVFFNNYPCRDIVKRLGPKEDRNLIMIVNCKIDDQEITLQTSKDLEMLFITNCGVDYFPQMGNIETLTYLDMTFNSLLTIPTDIGTLSALRVLRLCGNQLTSIPDEIADLHFLQVLDLSQNSISHLPKKICSIRSLIHLNCNANFLVKLPSNISDLEHLEGLFLTNNMLTTLPKNVSLLKRLQRLKLDGNRFEYIPFYVFECTSLREVNFAYNLICGIIPENFCRLINLEVLCLEFNKFTHLPGKLASLAKLRYLNTRGNPIEKVPDVFFTQCKELRLINFGACALTSVPPELGECKHLRVLDLANNKISELPPDGSAFKDLNSLLLSNNGLNKLPEWIGNLENLISINLAGNKLVSLPESFRRVAATSRVLDLSHNEFESIPDCVFSEKSHLIYLSINFNPLLHAPVMINKLKLLTHLSISNCPYIYEIPEEIGDIPKLHALRLCSNSLSSLPRSLHLLDTLQYLDLSDNKFSRFPIVVCFLTHLKVLLFNGCCRICTFTEPDPPGWFERTDLIDPEASMDKLGKEYIEGTDNRADEDLDSITLDEALEAEEQAMKIPQLKPEEFAKLLYKRRALRIPKLICRLKFLVHLSLRANGLYHLPDVFNRLKYLERLYLNDNHLRAIPRSITACASLTHLDLRNNKLTELNTDLHRLPRLRYFHLGNNNFPTCLREIVNNSSIQGLFKYLDAEDRNSRKFVLQTIYTKYCYLNLLSRNNLVNLATAIS